MADLTPDLQLSLSWESMAESFQSLRSLSVSCFQVILGLPGPRFPAPCGSCKMWYFLVLWDHWVHFEYPEYIVLLKPVLGGIASVAYFITCHELTQLNSLLFSFLWCIPCFQRILLFRTYLSLLQLVLCRVAAVKCLPVHHHSADYIFWSFGITGFILSILNIEFCSSQC